MIKDFSPDAVLIDRLGHFGSAVIDAKIPLFILLRGHYWLEVEAAKNTLYNNKKMRTVIWFRNRISEKCFRNATMILPICKYLENVVKERYPSQSTSVFLEGINFVLIGIKILNNRISLRELYNMTPLPFKFIISNNIENSTRV